MSAPSDALFALPAETTRLPDRDPPRSVPSTHLVVHRRDREIEHARGWTLRGSVDAADDSRARAPFARLVKPATTPSSSRGGEIDGRLRSRASAFLASASLTLTGVGLVRNAPTMTARNGAVGGKTKSQKKPRQKRGGADANAERDGKRAEASASDNKNHATLKHLAVGAVSGGVSRSVVAPLERVKIEYMIDSGKVASEGGVMGSLRRIVRTEGAAGLFRGNLLNVMRIAPTKAVEFYCFDAFKKSRLRLKRDQRDGGGGAGQGNEELSLSGGERMLGGSLASMAGTALTHPVDTLRSRVTSTGMRMGEAWSGLMRNEGPMALWKGLSVNMIRVAPYGAVNFFVYDACKSAYKKTLKPGQEIGPLPTLFFGGLAGAAAQTAVYPLEMVQRRIQVSGMTSAVSAGSSAALTVKYKNVFHGIQCVYKTEGLGALYAGLVPNYAKIFPAAAVSFYVYEALKLHYGL